MNWKWFLSENDLKEIKVLNEFDWVSQMKKVKQQIDSFTLTS